jgi:hypothetical protein
MQSGASLDLMSFQQKTLDLAQQRVKELSAKFEDFISAFHAENLFSGPSLYFHHKTLQMRRELGSIEACLASDHFFESLYATLASWGLHRMGPGNAKLVELPIMISGFRQHAENLRRLEGLAIHELQSKNVLHTADLIWSLIRELPVGIGNTKIVSGSKALHHLLPGLVPPIDREYTVQFFLNSKNAIQGAETKQCEAFRLIYPYFAKICVERRTEIDQCLGRGMNTSATKVVDNAIVGYGRTVLKIRDERPDETR